MKHGKKKKKVKNLIEPEIIMSLGNFACKNVHKTYLITKCHDQAVGTKGIYFLMVFLVSCCREEIPLSWDDSLLRDFGSLPAHLQF